jgi:hypothetical protein
VICSLLALFYMYFFLAYHMFVKMPQPIFGVHFYSLEVFSCVSRFCTALEHLVHTLIDSYCFPLVLWCVLMGVGDG